MSVIKLELGLTLAVLVYACRLAVLILVLDTIRAAGERQADKARAAAAHALRQLGLALSPRSQSAETWLVFETPKGNKVLYRRESNFGDGVGHGVDGEVAGCGDGKAEEGDEGDDGLHFVRGRSDNYTVEVLGLLMDEVVRMQCLVCCGILCVEESACSCSYTRCLTSS